MRAVEEIFCELVMIDSPSGNEYAVADYVFNFLQDLEFAVQKDAVNNVFVFTDGTGDAVFFNAHLDTVEPGCGIVPIIEDGIIRSHGNTILGADNKAAVAAFLWAMQYRSLDSKSIWRPIDLVFTTSEETGNYGALAFDRSQLRARTGYIFDLEGDLGTVISESPYYARFDISLIGKSAHASRRFDAIPAVDALLALLPQIEELRTDFVLINIGSIHGGQARNTVLGQIEIHGEVRAFDQALFEGALAQIQSRCTALSCIKVDVEVVVENPGYQHNVNSLEIVVSQLSQILDIPIEVRRSFGCSDANIFNSDLSALQVFNLSDGSKNVHTVDEQISVNNLTKLSGMIVDLMRSTG